MDIEVEQPLAHLISHMLSGVNAQIAIKVYGDDLDVLEQIANRVKAVVATVPGVTPPVVEPLRKVDELHIRLRPDDLAFYGLSRAYVAEFVQTALQGESRSRRCWKGSGASTSSSGWKNRTGHGLSPTWASCGSTCPTGGAR